MNPHQPAYVYGFYDGDTPIYIGASVNPKRRAADHRRDAPWWTPELVMRIIAEYPNHWTACFEENLLIRKHQPVGNLLGNPRYGRAREHANVRNGIYIGREDVA